MSTLAELAIRFATDERPASNLLNVPELVAQAAAAARMYAGYAALRSHVGLALTPAITGDTEISVSEWAVIRPLFLLYIERETAPQLEASRMFGVDGFGRSSGEIAADIQALEQDMPKRAFIQSIITV